MFKDMQERTQAEGAAFDKFLGHVATALESWRLVLLPAILVGIGVSLFFYLQPRVFESSAILTLANEDLIVLKSSRVFDKAAEAAVEAGFAKNTEDVKLQIVSVSNVPRTAQTGNTDSYQVSLTLPSAEGAAKILGDMIELLVEATKPTESEKTRLEIRLAELKKAHENLSQSLDKISKLYDLAPGEAGADTRANSPMDNLGQSSVALADAITSKTDEIFKTQDALRGSFIPNDVLQPPTIPKKPLERVAGPFVVLAVALTMAFFLVFALARAALIAATNSENMQRIRRVIGLQV